MTNKFKYMQLQTLDDHLSRVNVCDRPSGGWIRAVRTSLGMSVRQMAERIGITQQSAARLEKNEINDAITLRSLRKAAEALDCRLVYVFVPNDGSLRNIVRKQALRKARDIVDPVDHSMMLEAQDVGDRQEKTAQIADELVRNPAISLWD
ncbi:MAG: mobile mystery protein A [Candidatus Dadabacteria bacterium]|nr:mobile mystery protein A [Candidatus Dadabacteria bacterium]MCY3826440.1 mobile mystery protein A [Candidatus Dadabacteria bacterium]MDE0292305.1 mobile mystery protein A [Candidatus Dadabacteria bacterium]MDE0520003.1 mobile mystery protein A [Candidatus Dadabacteria bacterium]MDE0663409.1 mobile mystery protein A [Candidatus Dadabacteria bacterium]